MGIYGESVLLVQEAVDPNRRELMKKINQSIRDSLFDIGIDAKVTDKIIFNGAWGFKRRKRDSFEIQININGINSTKIVNHYDRDGYSGQSIEFDHTIRAQNEKNRFDAMQAIVKNIDKIKSNLKRDVKEAEVKMEKPVKDYNETGFTIKAYVVEK